MRWIQSSWTSQWEILGTIGTFHIIYFYWPIPIIFNNCGPGASSSDVTLHTIKHTKGELELLMLGYKLIQEIEHALIQVLQVEQHSTTVT